MVFSLVAQPIPRSAGAHDRRRYFFQRLSAAEERLAEVAPEIIAHPEAARGFEQALIEALVGCLSTGEVREDRLARQHHSLLPISQSAPPMEDDQSDATMRISSQDGQR
jgi:hypothetical protein